MTSTLCKLRVNHCPSQSDNTAGQQVIDFPAGVIVGSIIHQIFEEIDTTIVPLEEEIERIVKDKISNGRLRHFGENLCKMVQETLLYFFAAPLVPFQNPSQVYSVTVGYLLNDHFQRAH